MSRSCGAVFGSLSVGCGVSTKKTKILGRLVTRSPTPECIFQFYTESNAAYLSCLQPAVPPRPTPPSAETLSQVKSHSLGDTANVAEPTRPPPPSPGTLARRVSLVQLDEEPGVANTTVWCLLLFWGREGWGRGKRTRILNNDPMCIIL